MTSPVLDRSVKDWICLVGSPENLAGTDFRVLQAEGYDLATTHRVHRTIIYSFVRS